MPTVTIPCPCCPPASGSGGRGSGSGSALGGSCCDPSIILPQNLTVNILLIGGGFPQPNGSCPGLRSLTGFGERLKAVREAAGLTQDQLAERAGLYKFSIAKLEQGVREPTWATVQTLARALGVTCEAFTDPELQPPADSEPARPRGRPRKADAAANAGQGDSATPTAKKLTRKRKEK